MCEFDMCVWCVCEFPAKGHSKILQRLTLAVLTALFYSVLKCGHFEHASPEGCVCVCVCVC